MLVFDTSYYFIPVFKWNICISFVNPVCRRLTAVCSQKSASQGAPLLELHYVVKTIWDCRSFWPISGWRIKIFLLSASVCISTDDNDSQLRLALVCISSLTCLVFFQLLTKLKQPCFSLLPCCDGAEPYQSCHALQLLMCRNGVQTTFQSHLLPAWLVCVQFSQGSSRKRSPALSPHVSSCHEK